MTITELTTVSEIAGSLPSSVRVFQRHGIDVCCGGKRPIGAVCLERGLSFGDITHEIETSGSPAGGDQRDWTSESLGALIDYILNTYHRPLREELPRLEFMAEKVSRVHGDKAGYLARLHAVVTELSADLHSHMQKEEIVLFPAIRAIESGRAGLSRAIAAPISVMEHEHDRAGELLSELRAITGGYTPPEWACATFRALYHGLEELESAMHVHVHLENNILFPRALTEVRAGL